MNVKIILNNHLQQSIRTYSMSFHPNIKNNHDAYRGKDYTEKFCKWLKKQTMVTMNFKKKKMKVSTNEQQKTHKKFKLTLKNIIKLQIVSIMQVNIAHSICNLKYSIPKKAIVIFHDGSKYDYHFTIKDLEEEFEGQFTCLGENTEKYIAFQFLQKKKIW